MSCCKSDSPSGCFFLKRSFKRYDTIVCRMSAGVHFPLESQKHSSQKRALVVPRRRSEVQRADGNDAFLLDAVAAATDFEVCVGVCSRSRRFRGTRTVALSRPHHQIFRDIQNDLAEFSRFTKLVNFAHFCAGLPRFTIGLLRHDGGRRWERRRRRGVRGCVSSNSKLAPNFAGLNRLAPDRPRKSPQVSKQMQTVRSRYRFNAWKQDQE